MEGGAMGKCLKCSRISQILTETKMCKTCSEEFIVVVPRRIQIIDDSIKIINSSPNIDTVLSRYGIILEHLAFIRDNYEVFGIDNFSMLPSAFYNQIENSREKIIMGTFQRLFDKYQDKFKTIKRGSTVTRMIFEYCDQVDRYQKLITDQEVNEELSRLKEEIMKVERKE
jgi:hypothetical protein